MIQYKKAAFYTLGCKLNFAETSTISRLFEDGGYAKVDFHEMADVYVINTCSVTENANKKCRNIVRKALSINPVAFIVVVGCYAQLKPKEIAEIPGVDVVLGANEKFDVLSHLNALEKQECTQINNTEIKTVKDFVPSYSLSDRTRSFLKIQDGCDYFCSFCTIPLARGTSRSASISSTLKEAHKIAQKGIKEVVLTGVNIGDFGKETNETFYELIQQLDAIEGIARFRISSIEPNLLSDEIIEFVAKSKRFAPHFHIPLQSGSNKLLKAMRRRYDQQLYTNRVKKIKELMPNCCIGVDVIVGFPGETDEDFKTTYNYLNELDISYLHVFTYSERDNTTAIRMGNVVPVSVRNERNAMLRILSEKKKRKFYEENLRHHSTVLWESENEDGFMHGFTENYVKVQSLYHPEKINNLQQVELNTINNKGIIEVEAPIVPKQNKLETA